MKNLTKHFILYVPEQDQTIVSVKMKSTYCKSLNGIRMREVKNSEGLWEAYVTIPLAADKDPEDIYFSFAVHAVVTHLKIFTRDAYYPSEQRKLTVSETQLEIWDGFVVGGIYAHCHYILQCVYLGTSGSPNIKEAIIEIEQFSYYSLKPEDILFIVDQLGKAVPLNNNRCLLVFAAFLGKALSSVAAVKKNNIISVEMARALVDSLKSHSYTDFPTSAMKYLPELTKRLCKLVHEDNYCFLTWMAELYHFFPASHFQQDLLEVVTKYRERFISTLGDPGFLSEKARHVCYLLFSSAVDTPLKVHQEILERMFLQFPNGIRVKVYKYLHHCFYSKESIHEILQKLWETLKTGFRASISSAKSKNNFEDVLVMWKLASEIPDLAKSFQDQVEKEIVDMLERVADRVSEKALEVVPELCLGQNLYIFPDRQCLLLKTLSESKKKFLHGLFITLLHDEKFSKAGGELPPEVGVTWFEMAKTHCTSKLYSRKQDDIPQLYSYLCDVLSVPCFVGNDALREKLEDVMLKKFLKYVEPREVLQKASEIEKLAESKASIGDLFAEQMKVFLPEKLGSKKQHEVLLELCGSSGKLRVNSRPTASVVSTVLDIYGLKSGETAEEVFMKIASNHKFWLIVFSVSGKKAHEVQQHTSFKLALQCIEYILNAFMTRDVNCSFVEKLKAEVGLQKVKDLLAVVEDISLYKFEKLWTDALQGIQREKEKVKLVRSVLHTVCIEMSKDDLPEGFMVVSKSVEDIEKKLKAGKLCMRELDDEKGLWVKLSKFPSVCKYLEIPCTSKVFWNVGMDDILTEFETSKVDPSEDDSSNEEDSAVESLAQMFGEKMSIAEDSSASVDVGPTLKLLHVLVEVGCQKYRETWQSLYEKEGTPMSTVQEMFDNDADIPKEIKIAEFVMQLPFRGQCKDALQRIWDFSNYHKKVKAMKSSLQAFKINPESDLAFTEAVSAFESLQKGDVGSLTLQDVGSALETVYSVAAVLSDEAVRILGEIGRSTTLIEFLKEVVDEDIRNLIDAVEEVSEQYVRESTVSGLIEVKRFLQPLLKQKFDTKASSFFTSISKQCRELDSQKGVSSKDTHKIPEKLKDCMDNLHNLKSLYKNVANRGERTKEIVENVVRRGRFHFYMQKGSSCDFKVTYRQDKKSVNHTKTSLVDLRSRALLLMNTERKSVDDASKKKDYLEKFVRYVDLSLEIAEACTNLQLSGHFEFEQLDSKEEPKKLESLKENLLFEYSGWNWKLQTCREQHYIMNYIYGNQIQNFLSYLQKGEGERKVDTMLKFIHPGMKIEGLRNYYQSIESDMKDSLLDTLLKLGQTLEFGKQHLEPIVRTFQLDTSRIKITDIVQKGRLHVVSLEENNLQVLNTILALYNNTTRRLPEPNQILFCSRDTSLDELKLLIQRCLGAQKQDDLFCIANVELLSSENQFHLVQELRHMPEFGKYLLSIICRGSDHHPFLNELSDCVMAVRPLTDKELRTVLQNICPEVTTVTSDVPGLGKSESIYQSAFLKQKQVVALHISGPMHKRHLVERLASLNVEQSCVLHIDIGGVDNPVELDTFLFELIILGFVSAGTAAVYLPTRDIYIEIANTISQSLRNSLRTAVCFKRSHLVWQDYTDFVVSKEVNSPVQVVCHYLQHLDNGDADKKDVYFTGKNAVGPLKPATCRKLLFKYFSTVGDMSFTTANIFISVLADQLKKLSCSSFFRSANISAMLGKKSVHCVKSNLVSAMLEVSREFASRSVTSCRSTQASTLMVDDDKRESNKSCSTGEAAADRVAGMIRWDDSNHLIFVFHNQDIQTISAMYRDVKKVPSYIKNLFESQMKKSLADFRQMDQDHLQDILQRVARTDPKPLPSKRLQELASGYALTPDNLLKMVLIMLRIKAHVPVLIMGETGCGKTSLIKYLSEICEVAFEVVSIHAGVEEQTIVDKVMALNKTAYSLFKKRKGVWVFLDEINTCDHLGLISDIVCHHRCLGKLLAPNLVLMAACNPYKLRSESAIFTAGLQGKARTDELSRLVYRVHALPESIVDYVWDFGSLSDKDEESYIARMVQSSFKDRSKCLLFADLLALSQKFAREKQGTDGCTSLRDVSRCRKLALWFKEILERKTSLKSNLLFLGSETIANRSMVLALAHCYHSRFADNDMREEYRKAIAKVFTKHHIHLDESDVGQIIKKEQMDILQRMELPPGTAQNTALRENVFVILVCILNRIPIFVVGKPGCSKSLSMQVIRSNLRGKDSKDELFKTLPQLYCVSFQGSESSTSDGIIKVFEKAQNYQASNNPDEVLSVVILDEIGLAEISRFNPLKVLHSLLEPVGKECPDVAVVGISNWALDAAKMNRAIHLSRPEMDVEELLETSISISDSLSVREEEEAGLLFKSSNKGVTSSVYIQQELKGIAESYVQYINNQRFKNFHGLRDFYSLVKHIARVLSDVSTVDLTPELKRDAIIHGLQRNFGGLPTELTTLIGIFQIHLGCLKDKKLPVMHLIKDNILDKSARHLMIITTGDAVMGILQQQLTQLDRQTEVIFGSQFEEDLTDDYSYRILSRIILCMEQGLVLILKDLETIYGSLYDMLNQNYTIVGGKKNCRVALGHYSNPMCHVHDDFRCIVLVEESKLNLSDPPFLNRFEKQNLRFKDILTKEENEVITELTQWVDDMSTVPRKHFSPRESFPIFSEDMVPSVLLHVCGREKLSVEADRYDVINRCKRELLWILKPENVVRLQHSHYAQNVEHIEEVRDIKEIFFDLPIHRGLNVFLEHLLQTSGQMVVVFTHGNIHTNLSTCSEGFECQIEKLGAFKSEKQLSSRIQHFWFESDAEILFLQCKPADDDAHILLSKSIVEATSEEYGKSEKAGSNKHVIFLMHLDRTEDGNSVPQINFLSNWKLATIDCLETPNIPLPEMCQYSLLEAIWKKSPLTSYIREQLFWAFTRIGYIMGGRDINSTRDLIEHMSSSETFLSTMDTLVLEQIQGGSSMHDVADWQVEVASDVHALNTASSLVDALEQHILQTINDPLAKLIFELEKANVLDAFFVDDLWKAERRKAWVEMLNNQDLFSVKETRAPTGAECYLCPGPMYCLKLPFFRYFFEKVESTKEEFMDLLNTVVARYDLDAVEELPVSVFDQLLMQHDYIVKKEIAGIICYENWHEDYLHDFCNIMSLSRNSSLTDGQRIEIVKWSILQHTLLSDEVPSEYVTKLHATWWIHSSLFLAALQLIETCQELLELDGETLIKELESTENMKSTKVDEVQVEGEDTEHPVDTEAASEESSTDEDEYFADVKELFDLKNESGSKVTPEEAFAQKDNGIKSPTKEASADTSSEAENAGEITDGCPNLNVHDADEDALSDTNPENVILEVENMEGGCQNAQEIPDLFSLIEKTETVLMQEKKEASNDYGESEDSYKVRDESAKEGKLGRNDTEIAAVESGSLMDDFAEVDTQRETDETEEANEENLEATFKFQNALSPSIALEKEKLSKMANSGQSESSEDPEESPASPHSRLVEFVCRQMIPSLKVLDKMHNDLDEWIQRASSILSLSAQVSVDPSILHSLRFCSDIAGFILMHDIPGVLALQRIGNLLGEENEELDSSPVSEHVLEMIQDFSYSLDTEATTKLLSSYISRCIGANPDSEILTWLFCAVAEQKLPKVDFTYLKSPIHQALNMELTCEPDFGTGLLDKSEEVLEKVEENMFFASLDGCLKCLFDLGTVDTEFVILMIDLYEEHFETEVFNEELMRSTTTEDGFQRLLEVGKILNSDKFSLTYIVAVAYFRCFVKILTSCLNHSNYNMQPFAFALNTLNAVLTTSGSEDRCGQAMQMFFLKMVRHGQINPEVVKLVDSLEDKMPVLKGLEWVKSDHVVSLNGNLLGLQAPHAVPSIQAAMESLLKGGKDKMQSLLKIINEAKGDPEALVSLNYIGFSYFYLMSSICSLNDTLRSTGDIIYNAAAEHKLNKNALSLLSCLIRREDFKLGYLLLHEGSKEEQIVVSTVLGHLFVMLTSFSSTMTKSKSDSFFVSCFLKPGKMEKSYVPGTLEKWEAEDIGTSEPISGDFQVYNTCLQRYVLKSCVETDSVTCPVCNREDSHCPEIIPEVKSVDGKSSYGFYITETDAAVNPKMRNLSPASVHVLGVLVNGCLVGSLALGHSTPTEMDHLVKKNRRPSENEEGMDAQTEDIDSVLLQEIHKHWQCLSKLLGLQNGDVSLLMQIILARTRTLLCEDPRMMLTVEERDSWEQQFTEIVDCIVSDRFLVIHGTLQMLNKVYDYPESALENQLQEVVSEKEKPEDFTDQLSSFYRLTGTPSLEGLKCELEIRNVPNEFPFLRFTLANLECLQMVQHIIPLLRWHFACATHASYQMKRKECMEATVSDFLHRDDAEKQKIVKKRFEQFQKAWHFLKEHSHFFEGLDSDVPPIQRIHFQSKLSEALILHPESHVFLVLQALVRMQNWFLDETLKATASTNCAALGFLRKGSGVAAVRVVSLLEAKADNLVKFVWDDELLKYSQCSLQYGCGQKVVYDFGKIEFELAVEIVMNKSHLSMDKLLPKIIFNDELFQNYATMIQEFKKVIPQRSLSSDIKLGVEKKKESNPKQILELLTQLGIILSLLKRTSGDPEMPLVDYLDSWSSILTRPFPKTLLPNPESGVKLCHIVALHELLEELNADAMIESLEDNYREELDSDLKCRLDEKLSKNVKAADLALKACKRFIHRCLSCREADISQSLHSYLSDPSFWPDGSIENGCIIVGTQPLPFDELFPKGLMVQHIYKTVDLIAAKIEEIHRKESRMSSAMSSFQGQPKVGGTKTTRKKMAKKYSKT